MSATLSTPSSSTTSVSLSSRLRMISDKLRSNSRCPSLSVEGMVDLAARCRIDEEQNADVKREMEAYSRLVVNKDDFEEIKAIGKGRYGTTVHLCRDITTANKELCALKSIPKKDTSNAFDPAQACKERNALCKAADSQWLVGLKYAMQDRANLYLVTEYLPGGDLRALMNRNDGALSEELTLFYMAELTMALNCLHKLGFSHLDLRPENVGIDRLGHAKLLDFGAAEEMDDEGHIFPGSNLYGCPLYLAPELPLALTKQAGNSHKRKLVDGRKCDFWSLGVLGLEMRSGQVRLLYRF